MARAGGTARKHAGPIVRLLRVHDDGGVSRYKAQENDTHKARSVGLSFSLVHAVRTCVIRFCSPSLSERNPIEGVARLFACTHKFFFRRFFLSAFFFVSAFLLRVFFRRFLSLVFLFFFSAVLFVSAFFLGRGGGGVGGVFFLGRGVYFFIFCRGVFFLSGCVFFRGVFFF